MVHLVDANVLIQAKNLYYAFDVCSGFWSWLEADYSPSVSVGSIDAVYHELVGGGDQLSDWAKVQKSNGFFLDESDTDTQKKFQEISNYIAQHSVYSIEKKNEFLSGADPWLVAYAAAHDSIIVTQEVLVPSNSKKVKIPNICKDFDVDYISTFELLRQYSVNFTL